MRAHFYQFNVIRHECNQRGGYRGVGADFDVLFLYNWDERLVKMRHMIPKPLYSIGLSYRQRK